MSTRTVLSALVGLGMLFASVGTANAEPARAEIYVAPGGSDAATGTSTDPLATLEGARDRLRELRISGSLGGGADVIIESGVYEQHETLALDERDSGSEGAEVRFVAAPGADVRITGGITIPGSGAIPVEDPAVLSRLPEAVRSSVVQIDLSAFGVSDLGEYRNYGYGNGTNPSQAELFVDGQPMAVAAWPNGGERSPIAEVVDPGSAPAAGDPGDRGAIFSIVDAPVERWAAADQMFASSYFWYGWAYESIPVAAVDTETGLLTLSGPHRYGVRGGQTWSSVVVSNLMEEIDAPGEYFIDHQTLMAYFYPRAAEPEAIQVSLLDGPLVSLVAASYLEFVGLTLENSRGSGIYIEGGTDVTVGGNVFRNLGEVAVTVGQGVSDGVPTSNVIGNIQSYLGSNSAWNRQGGEGHRIVSNDIYATGAGGIYVGAGDRASLTPSNIEVSNNHVTDYNRWLVTSAPAVWLMGVGITVEHNVIHGADQRAMFVNGNLHVIRLNEIYDVVREADDVGSIGMYRDPSEFGNLFEHNFFHDLGGDANAHGSQAIFLDDGTSGQIVRGNVFVRTGSNFAVKLHGGRHNEITNNIFVDLPTAVGISQWTESRWVETVNGADYQKKLLAQVDIRESPFLDRYPTLAGYVDADGAATVQPTNTNVVANNVTVNVNALTSTTDFTIGNNFQTTSDPGFNDPASLNYGLAADSVVYDHLPDFEPIPFDDIGLKTDEYRSSTSIDIADFSLLSPAPGATGVDATQPLNLEWAAATGAALYRVEVATDPDFSDVVFDETVHRTSTQAPLVLEGDTTYFWRVSASTGAASLTGMRVSSDAGATFSTAPGDPDAVAVVEPVATARADGGVLLSWGAAAGATAYQVARLAAGATDVVEELGAVEGTSYVDQQSSQLAPDQYIVRVVDGSGRVGAPSDPVSAAAPRERLYSTDFVDGLGAEWRAGPGTLAGDWEAGLDESTYPVLRYSATDDGPLISSQVLTPAASVQHQFAARLRITSGAPAGSAGVIATIGDTRLIVGVTVSGDFFAQRVDVPESRVTANDPVPPTSPHTVTVSLAAGRLIATADNGATLVLADEALDGAATTIGLYGDRVDSEFSTVELAGLEAASQQIPDGWQLADYGTAGSAVYDGGSFSVTSMCADVWNGSDQASYVWREVTMPASGQLQLHARVVEIGGANAGAMAGLMFRAADSADAANFYARLTAGGRLQTTYRLQAAAGTSYVSTPAVTPAEIRIVREGDTFTSFLLAADGTWTEGGSATIDMPQTFMVGIATCSRDAVNPATAVVEDVELSGEVDAVRPAVSMVLPTGAQPVQLLELQVEGTDDHGLARIVANIYGPDGQLVKSTQTRFDGAVSGTHLASVSLPDGAYTVRYNAQDTAGNISRTLLQTVTVDSTIPGVSVKEPDAFTRGDADNGYEYVSFKLADANQIDGFTLNGVARDLIDDRWSDIDQISPGRFGAVEGENTLVVSDVAGNTTTVTFVLNEG